jgi:hypothetical protein
LAYKAIGELTKEFSIVAGSDGRVEVDQLNERVFLEPHNPLVEVIKLKSFLFSLHKLNDLPAH